MGAAFAIVIVGSLFCSWMDGVNDVSKRIDGLARYSALKTVLSVVLSIIKLTADLGDSSTFGPAIAVGLLSLTYGWLVYFVAYGAQLTYVA